ncbi:MAG: S10 family peptidase [Alphaproteobacteria bacterium]
MRVKGWRKAFSVIGLATVLAFGALAPVVPGAGAAAAAEKSETPEPRSFTQKKSAVINDRRLSYTVTAGETFLKDGKGEPEASIFSIAYTLDGVNDRKNRPVTFVFNGGPGSASLWLHMGVFGPRRIDVPPGPDGVGAPPYDIVDNPFSILDVTDLVFIDPVGTGFSRALGNTEAKDYWGLEEDAASVAEFIRVYITENERWNSPRYIAGESYGTTRAAQLVHELTRTYNRIDVNGVILISAILDFQHARFRDGNIMPYLAFLPTYAATAWYHDKVENKPERLTDFIEEARQFALNDYARALLKGKRLSDAERAEVRRKLARYSGLSETYLEQTELKPSAFRYMKELLREEGQTVGRFDSRYTGEDADDAGETFENDPSAYRVFGAFVTAVHDYLTRELKVDFERKYEVLSFEVNRNWEWGPAGTQTYVNTAPHLGRAMRENTEFRVFVANGIYDLATPFHAVETTINHNGIDPERVTMEYYEAGHMMYVHDTSLKKMVDDVRAFIKDGD